MMMRRIAFWLLILSFFGCASTKMKTSSNEDIKVLNDLIQDGSFEIESVWAQPLTTNSLLQINNIGLLPPGSTAGNISLIGNTNFLRIKDNMVKAYLPFYGERRMAGINNNTKNAIEFGGLPKNYKVKKGKNNSYEIRFLIQDGNTPNENYNIKIQVFPNLSSVIAINSSHRSFIQYRGTANSIELNNNK